MPADPKGEKRAPPNFAADEKGGPKAALLACDRRSYAAPATSASARRTAGARSFDQIGPVVALEAAFNLTVGISVALK